MILGSDVYGPPCYRSSTPHDTKMLVFSVRQRGPFCYPISLLVCGAGAEIGSEGKLYTSM